MGQVETTDVGAPAAAPTVAVAPTVTPPRFSFAYRNGIDAKGRVVLPAPYRPHFAEGGKATVWRGPSLAAMTYADFDAYVAGVAASLAAGGEPDPGAILDVLWEHTIDVRPDIQGRISLPDSLRALAGLGSEVQFVGCGDRVEMRPVDDSAERAETVQDHLATLAMVQATYGLPRVGS